MIKSLIWALWSAEREGADGTFQSSETPIAILHYYWSLHWDKQRSIDPHTNKIREKKKKHLCTTRSWHSCRKTDRPTHRAERGKGEKEVSGIQIRVEGHCKPLVRLPVRLSVCLNIWIYICVKRSRGSLSVLQWHEWGKTGAWGN